MKQKTRTRILGGASLAGFAAAITLAFAPAAHAQTAASGGANHSLADGSVRFVRDSVDLGTYTAMPSRNGGEVIGTEY